MKHVYVVSKLKRYVSLLVVVTILLVCLTGCDSEDSLPKESVELFEQKIVRTDDGEFYVPTEHLLIMKDSDSNILFVVYENSSDRFVYDILSHTVIEIRGATSVRKALTQEYVWIRDKATDIFVLSMIPDLTTKMIELEDGKFYIKMSDLESVRTLLQDEKY